jgi:hypothetical protein
VLLLLTDVELVEHGLYKQQTIGVRLVVRVSFGPFNSVNVGSASLPACVGSQFQKKRHNEGSQKSERIKKRQGSTVGSGRK